VAWASTSFSFWWGARREAAVRSSVDLVALSLLPPGWGPEIGERLRAGQPAGGLLDELLAARPGDAARAFRLRRRAVGAAAAAEAAGIEAIGWDHPSYPAALAAIPDPPPVLWLRGCRQALAAPAVAIVGSRAGSPYALAVAHRLAADLARRGVAVVSGLARGVDSAAHRGALAAGGATLGVLGSGADVVYPPEHATLAETMARAAGAVVSELVPGTPPRPRFFPRRNRIISGLARAVVVIEAGDKSGSLITARCALEQGRDVLAVPGNVLDGRNRGGHALLRDGAKIVETADDILEELNLAPPEPPRGAGASKQQRAGTGPRDVVMASLAPGEPCDVDTLAARIGTPVKRLLPRLLELELQGRIERAGGGRWVRVDRAC
jgi:DNA processing protein